MAVPITQRSAPPFFVHLQCVGLSSWSGSTVWVPLCGTVPPRPFEPKAPLETMPCLWFLQLKHLLSDAPLEACKCFGRTTRVFARFKAVGHGAKKGLIDPVHIRFLVMVMLSALLAVIGSTDGFHPQSRGQVRWGISPRAHPASCRLQWGTQRECSAHGSISVGRYIFDSHMPYGRLRLYGPYAMRQDGPYAARQAKGRRQGPRPQSRATVLDE